MAKQRKESEMHRENNIIKTKQKFTALFWGVGGTTCEQSTSTSHFCDISTYDIFTLSNSTAGSRQIVFRVNEQ